MPFLPPSADFESQPAVRLAKRAFEGGSAASPCLQRKGGVRAWWVLAVSLTLWMLFAAQSSAQTYQWSTLAGPDGGMGSNDGVGSDAAFHYPGSVAVDASGNVYVADGSNHVIRKITSGGSVTTIAGTAGVTGSKWSRERGAV